MALESLEHSKRNRPILEHSEHYLTATSKKRSERKRLIEGLSSKHRLLAEVKEGSTTLEQTVKDYTDELFELMSGKDKLFHESFIPFQEKIYELGDLLDRIANTGKFWLPRHTNKSSSIRNNLFQLKSILENKRLRKILTSTAVGVNTAGLLAVGTGILTVPFAGLYSYLLLDNLHSYYTQVYKPYKEQKKKIAESFAELEGTCVLVDRQIHSLYLEEYYKKSAEEAKLVKYRTKTTAIFTDTFEGIPEEEKIVVVSSLLKLEGNPQIDGWLSEHYPSIVEYTGRESYLETGQL